MEQFNMDLKKGKTVGEMLSISDERFIALRDNINEELDKSNPKTLPEKLQVICNHCRNLNELTYICYLTGKQVGENEAAETKSGFVTMVGKPGGNLGLNFFM